MGKAVKKKEEAPVNIKSAVTQAVTGKFDKASLEKFKKAKNLNNTAAFKKQTWIPFSPALNKALGLPGVPEGQVTLLRGLSDTGKTTAMCEAATEAQKRGKLVVLIINEMKFSFDHLKKFGFETDEEVDEETGEIIHTGFFIYADRLMLPTIETTGKFILDLIQEQEAGKLNYDLFICVDSFGSLPSDMSYSTGKNDGRWNSMCMNLTFSSFINFKFPASRRLSSKFTNTMLAVNKQGIKLPATQMEKPKRTAKGGTSLYFDAGLVIDFGGVSDALTSKIEAEKNKNTVTFAKRTRVSIDKNHITNSHIAAKIIMTDYGFIEDTPSAINKYKEAHKHEWISTLGTGEFNIIQEEDKEEPEIVVYSDLVEED